MKVQSYAQAWQWIQKEATLDELIAKYPQEWEQVDAELFAIYSTGEVGALQKYIKRTPTTRPSPWVVCVKIPGAVKPGKPHHRE